MDDDVNGGQLNRSNEKILTMEFDINRKAASMKTKHKLYMKDRLKLNRR